MSDKKKGQGRNGRRKKKKIGIRKKRENVEKDNTEGMNCRKREKRAPIFWFLD
jgi:hypothetical protein